MWTSETFRTKSRLFKIIMDYKWRFAERDAFLIENILKEFGIIKGKILDLMCGNGRISINLAKHGYRVIGVDFSRDFIHDAVSKAREFGLISSVRFICGDVRNLKELNIGTGYDAALLVWSSLGYYTREEDLKILRNICSVVRKEGLLILFDILLRDNYTPLHPFSFISYRSYHIYSIEEINESGDKLLRKWNIFQIGRNGKYEYIGTIKMKIILYSTKELTELLKKAGWKRILVENREGISSIIAQK